MNRVFLRDVVTTLTGTVAAQVLVIAVLPLLTRHYSVVDFGYYGIYTAAVSLIAIFVNLRFDLTVITATSEEQASRMVSVSLLCAGVLSLIASVVAGLGVMIWWLLLGGRPLFWIIAVPIAAASVSVFNTLGAWHGRRSRFSMIARARFSQALTMIGLQGAFVWLIPLDSGLIVGVFLASCSTSILWLFRTLRMDNHLDLSGGKINVLEEIVRRKFFSAKAITVDGLSQLLTQLPVFLLGYYFSAKEIGYFTLTQRVLVVPSSVLGNAVSEVFRQRATRAFSEYGNCRVLFIRTAIALAAIVLLFGIPVFVAVPEMFVLIFGNQWREAGIYAQILLPAFALKFISHPLSYTILFRNRLGFEVILHLAMLVSLALGIVIVAYWGMGIKEILIYYSAVFVCSYLAYLYFSYQLSKGMLPVGSGKNG